MTINPVVNWFRWLRAWRRIWWVHFLNWRAYKDLVPIDAELLKIVEETIRDYAPDAEIVPNNEGVYHCEGCDARETVLVKTNASQPLPHDFLCAGCWLDGLLQENKTESEKLKNRGQSV